MATPPSEWESYLLELINASRAEVGAGALSFDGELMEAAGGHTAWMLAADAFGHAGEGGSTLGQRAGEAGYGYRALAENIAWVGGPDQAVLDAADVELLHANLMASPGHRANLLNPDYTEVGLGIGQGDFRGWPAVLVTEVFGLPDAGEAAEPDDWLA